MTALLDLPLHRECLMAGFEVGLPFAVVDPAADGAIGPQAGGLGVVGAQVLVDPRVVPHGFGVLLQFVLAELVFAPDGGKGGGAGFLFFRRGFGHFSGGFPARVIAHAGGAFDGFAQDAVVEVAGGGKAFVQNARGSCVRFEREGGDERGVGAGRRHAFGFRCNPSRF